MISRIHLLGAPGSGVTSLGKALAGHLDYPFFDTDNYYWFTDDALPFRRKRNPQHRLQVMSADLKQAPCFVLSGAMLGWGDVWSPRFEAVVYRWLPADIRRARIWQRECERYGRERVSPGGDLHPVYEKFVEWAARYDLEPDNRRSRQAELAWLDTLSCPVLRLEEDLPLDVLVQQTLAFLAKI
ncbi:MAG: hypothetical protein IT260_23865 [Saprospiraceae bacterium]|nr:hypothetical protein [Saprospiraceae bacterium]